MSESTSFPISATHFGDLDEAACDGCQGEGRQLGFEFSYAFQPIVDLRVGSIYAYEALVRGPNGESAGCVLAQVTDHNRYRFDQACRVKAIKDAERDWLWQQGARLMQGYLFARPAFQRLVPADEIEALLR